MLFIYSRIGANQDCIFPSVEQLKNLNALGGLNENYLIEGKVIELSRIKFREQKPMIQIRDLSWDYFRFQAKVIVTGNFTKMKVFPNPVIGETIHIGLETSYPWSLDEHPYRKLLAFSSPKKITYLHRLCEYIFCMNLAAGYRCMYTLYAPKGSYFTKRCDDCQDQICKAPKPGCNNFYVWPMFVDGDEVEVRVQYYGSNEIVRKRFKYEEIVNLYKEQPAQKKIDKTPRNRGQK